MDRQIEDKRFIKPKHWKYIAGVAVLFIILGALIFRDNSSSLRVEKDKITVDQVFKGSFQDYIRVVGLVEPISFVYLDAVEGGMVDEILIEEGNMVHEGDVILKLSNTNLNLSILESEAQLAEKSNFLRETQLNMEQQKLSLQRELLRIDYEVIQKKRTFEQDTELYKDELISREDYLRSKEDYQLALETRKVMMERSRYDSIFRKNQIAKISLNLNNMQRNLELVYKRQDDLNVKAPVDGQLGLLNPKRGQSINVGQRIGQINVLTSYKVKAQIDEHYIDRVRNGLKAYFEREADTFYLELSKVYPEVRDGRFEVDLLFKSNLPPNIRAGQSFQISLQLGETQEAIQVARGGFYQSTGGQWIYVLTNDGKTAVKRKIQIGKQNPQYYEVVEGLKQGEKVVTSSYDTFGENDKLILN